MKCAVLALSLCPVALSAQISPPANGAGTLGIIFSGAEYSLSLVVPSADLLGFEHPTLSEDDRAMVAGAISDLSRPLELFVVPTEAGCFTASANVILTGEGLVQNESGGTDGQSVGDQPRSEFQADYVIQCQNMAALNTIDFAYFDRFEKTGKLEVQVEAPGDARSLSVTRGSRLLDIGGIQR